MLAVHEDRLAAAVERLGSENAFEILARARELEARGRRVVHMEIGEPDFDTPEHIKRRPGGRAIDEFHALRALNPGLIVVSRTVIADYATPFSRAAHPQCRLRERRRRAGCQGDHLEPDDRAARSGRRDGHTPLSRPIRRTPSCGEYYARRDPVPVPLRESRKLTASIIDETDRRRVNPTHESAESSIQPAAIPTGGVLHARERPAPRLPDLAEKFPRLRHHDRRDLQPQHLPGERFRRSRVTSTCATARSSSTASPKPTR